MKFWNKTKQMKQITHQHSIDLFIRVNVVNVFISKRVFGLSFQRSLEEIKNNSKKSPKHTKTTTKKSKNYSQNQKTPKTRKKSQKTELIST